MAMFGEVDNQLPDQEPSEPIKVKNKIETDVFRGITIDTEYVPRSSLLQWIEGSLYTGDYYSQYLAEHNEPMPLSLNKSPVYQQYRLIKDMDLKITSPISPSFDPETRVPIVTGSGVTYPFLVPQQGDMWVGDIGDGRIGLFTVTSATRTTIRKDTTYAIDLVLVNELSEAHLADLNRKTIDTFQFSRESLIAGCGPFVNETQYQRRSDYLKLREELIERYLGDFYSRQHTTLLVPDQMLTTYDHFVTKAVREIVGLDKHALMRKVRELPVAVEQIMTRSTLWDAIIRHEPNRLIQMIQRAHLVSTQLFYNRPVLQSLNYTGIKRIVFPMEPASDVDAYYKGYSDRNLAGLKMEEGRPRYRPEGEYQTQAERELPWFRPIDPESETMAERLPALHPVVHDDHYVLSESFYKDGMEASQSCLEVITKQVMNAQPVSIPHLEVVLTDVWNWDNLERYYYYPLVWMALTLGGRY